MYFVSSYDILFHVVKQYMLSWSSGQDVALSRRNQGFDSPREYQKNNPESVSFQDYFGSVKNVGVEDTPRISEPLSFFEKTLFSSAPTGVSHR